MQSCTNSNAAKAPPDPVNNISQVEVLKDMGFTSVVEIKQLAANEHKAKWAKYGLTFLSKDEVDLYMTENDFIMGPTDRYIGNMPKSAADALVANYNKIRKINLPAMYTDPIGRKWTQNQVDAMSERDRNWVYEGSGIVPPVISVIAPAKKFNTEGMLISNRQLKVDHPDPKVVYKVQDGYIELASW
jgi:hypothetical protein